jgi:hypothetical protein
MNDQMRIAGLFFLVAWLIYDKNKKGGIIDKYLVPILIATAGVQSLGKSFGWW